MIVIFFDLSLILLFLFIGRLEEELLSDLVSNHECDIIGCILSSGVNTTYRPSFIHLRGARRWSILGVLLGVELLRLVLMMIIVMIIVEITNLSKSLLLRDWLGCFM